MHVFGVVAAGQETTRMHAEGIKSWYKIGAVQHYIMTDLLYTRSLISGHYDFPVLILN